MTSIPQVPAWQLAIRFGLELVSVWAVASATLARFGDDALGWTAALAAATAVVAVWGVFNVRGDPSRSGKAPIAVPGVVRLILELAVFGAGAVGLALLHRWPFFVAFTVTAIIHHAGTMPRLHWLVAQK